MGLKIDEDSLLANLSIVMNAYKGQGGDRVQRVKSLVMDYLMNLSFATEDPNAKTVIQIREYLEANLDFPLERCMGSLFEKVFTLTVDLIDEGGTLRMLTFTLELIEWHL